VNRPTVFCTVRETTSAAGASCAARACESSKAVAPSTAGSPATVAKPVASTAASAPATSPQIRSVLSMAAP
jgi:hypothetical protein